MTGQTTIFALSSGRGRAGVAVVRISGPSAGLVLDRMAPPRARHRQAAFRRIVHPVTGELLDAALVLFFAAPASETGEDIAELQLHGSPAVLRSVLEALALVPGCRLAEPGEFARRAFLNGKIDLSAAEGLADLIDAETDAQRRQALAQAGGAFGRLCEGWRQRLIEARAMAEAAIDFSDEADVATDALGEARALAAGIAPEIGRLLADANRGEIIREGFRVVIAGPPNVGKSSLLNVLAMREVAIVSPEPGTTRDALEAHLDLGGYAVIVTDTAGLREDAGLVEQEGMRRARERARQADLVIWLVDATAPIWRPPDDLLAGPQRCLVVANKVDLPSPQAADAPSGTLLISARTSAGIETLIDRLGQEVAARLDAGAGSSLLPTHARHRTALADCAASLARLSSAPEMPPELVAEDLRIAADALGRITGRIDVDEFLDLIFGRFCIGK